MTAIYLVVGFLIGYFSKGINITVFNKEEDVKEQEYNESPVNMIDPEHRQYLERNHGLIK